MNSTPNEKSKPKTEKTSILKVKIHKYIKNKTEFRSRIGRAIKR